MGFKTKLGRKLGAEYGHIKPEIVHQAQSSLSKAKQTGPSVGNAIRASKQFIADSQEIKETIDRDFRLTVAKSKVSSVPVEHVAPRPCS